jgi:hypothetical protein
MAYDDPKLPRAVLRGEELYVGNDKEPYFRDPDYVIHLDVTDLKVAGGLESSDPMEGRSPKVAVAPGLRGLARLGGRDKFAGAGFDAGKNPRIEFHLRTVGADETRFHWAASVGYSMPDWEFESEPGFWVQGYCTQPEFDRVLAAVGSGHVERLRVALTTTMWTKQKSNGFMPGMPMTLCLAPSTDKESTTPALERGFIRSITWDETYGARTPAPVDEDAAPPKPQPVELPARFYSLLTGILGLLAFVAVLTMLRR